MNTERHGQHASEPERSNAMLSEVERAFSAKQKVARLEVGVAKKSDQNPIGSKRTQKRHGRTFLFG